MLVNVSLTEPSTQAPRKLPSCTSCQLLKFVLSAVKELAASENVIERQLIVTYDLSVFLLLNKCIVLFRFTKSKGEFR